MNERPADVCRGLLAALETSERGLQRRECNTTPDAVGLGIKHAILELVVADNPDAEDFEGWSLEQCAARCEPYGAGVIRATTRQLPCCSIAPASNGPGNRSARASRKG